MGTKIVIDGKLWHIAKTRVGSRASRKRDSKKRRGISAFVRVWQEYDELLKKRDAVKPA